MITIVVAPDKFKGSLTAEEAANAIEHGNLEISFDEKTTCLEKDPRGMETLFQNGIRKAEKGLTSLEEVLSKTLGME